MKLQDKHAAMPGAPDLLRLKRSFTIVQAEKARKENEKLEKEGTRNKNINGVSQLEDDMQHRDILEDLEANLPPVSKQQRKARNTNQADVTNVKDPVENSKPLISISMLESLTALLQYKIC
jgi:hypothetical protein